MTKEQAIVTTLYISRFQQRIYFQISLPRDTIRITGFEYGVIPHLVEFFPGPSLDNTVDEIFLVNANKNIGRLTLQAPGFENIFLQTDLIEYRNMIMGEVVPSFWEPTFPTHKRNSKEMGLSVGSNTTFIEGIFVDQWNAGLYISFTYRLHLYLWIEKNVS